MNFFKKAKKGFTLVELVVVIAVIAILAAVSVGAYFGVTESANNSKAEQEAKQAYTQLQTKTLAGLDLGSSGTNVSLTSSGLVFNGLYDDNILEEFGQLVFDQSIIYDVIAGTEAITENVPVSENARIYFFANKDRNNNAVASYMGYVPASLSSKYIKYINLGNGEFESELSGTFDSSILPEGLEIDTIDYKKFNHNVVNESYQSIGSYVSAYGTYAGFAMAKKDKVDNPYNLLQIRASDKSGILMTDSKYAIKYISIDWANDQYTENGDNIAVYTQDLVAFTTFDANLSGNPINNIAYPNKFLKINDDFTYFTRITSGNGTTTINSVSIYFDTNNQKPNVPSNITFEHEGQLKSNILVKETTPISITTNTPVTFTSEVIKGNVNVEINGNVITNTNNEAGIVRLTATSTIYSKLTKTIDIEYRPLEQYSYGLVNDVSDLTDGSKIVFVNSSRTGHMGIQTGSHQSVVETPADPAGATSYSKDNLSFNFNNYSDTQIFTIKNYVFEGQNYIAFENGIDEDGNPQALRAASSNELKLYDLYENFGKDNQTLYNGALFSVKELNVSTGEARIVPLKYSDSTRAICHYVNNSTNRFGTYATPAQSGTSQLVCIYKLNANTNMSLTAIEANTTSSYLKVDEEATITITKIPSFTTDTSSDITYTGFDSSIIEVSNDGIVKAKSDGITSVTVTCGGKSDVITFTVAEAKNEIVSSISQLEIGARYAIAAANSDIALSRNGGGNNIPGTDTISKDGDFLNILSNSVELFTLEEGLNQNTYSFKTISGKYIYAASSKDNHLKYEEEKSLNSSWSISIDSSTRVASIVAQGSNTKNILKYNSSNKAFSCYGSGQNDVVLYKVDTIKENNPYLISLSSDSSTINVGDITTHSFEVNVVNYFGKIMEGCNVTAEIITGNDIIQNLSIANNVVSFNSKGVVGESCIKISYENLEPVTHSINVIEPLSNLDPLILDKSFTGVNNSYLPWDKSNDKFTIMGQSSGGNSSIQLRAQNPSGIIINLKISNFEIDKIEIEWNTNTTNDRTLDVYSSENKYSGTEDLYSTTPGTKEGSIVYGTTTSLEFTEDKNVTNIGLRSSRGAMYISKITISFRQA